ncbi:hypothetical protein D0864_03052 [Hortaea werneckii]|uniref:Pheromone-regulated membrane protein 6 n=1 Tax=Hortaea werneckii TaxID=91943 RepID=A0A3M7FFH3_HORWE|nr:hypothetical protein KC323_g5474 [Hortaea werneckii]RMY87563.1 hypothetical protein D0862_10666 [Hortaea werneckii]RMZ03058.1 hypothetical protein D0864_03052 [Hortaea werneckii]
MGCFGGDREKGKALPEQSAKWAFITLSDFKCTSNWTPLAYLWLWIMALVGVAVYAVDTFTAINLLVFNRWSSQIKPAIDFEISKWIFAGCILLSWALAFYEWFRAIRVMKRGGVAEGYMDPLAATLYSMKPPQGWRRFLVFSELTKSKKGVDYVAFFVYFAFNGAVRVILAEGPRQFVNGMTLYAVMQADVIPGANAEHSAFSQFWINLKELAEKDEKQAVILFSMLFTLIIWVISALSLLVAIVLYVVFLWHYIPQQDGRLAVYCKRKIDKRLEKIVEHKVKAAMEEEERKTAKEERKADLRRQKTGELPPPRPVVARQPTLPQIPGGTPDPSKGKEDEKMAGAFGLARQDTSTTVSTLPRYESRPPTRSGSDRAQRQPTLPDSSLDFATRPGMPDRTDTQASAWSSAPSYESDAPLLSNAGYAGGRSSPAPPMPPPPAFSRQASEASLGRPMPARQGSHPTVRNQTPVGRMNTFGSQQQQRPFSPMSNAGRSHSRPPPEPRGPPMRSNTGFSFDDQAQPAFNPRAGPTRPYNAPMGPPPRANTADSFRSAPPATRQDSQASMAPSFSRPMYGSLHSHQSSFSRPTPPPAQPQTIPQGQPTNFTDRPFSPAMNDASNFGPPGAESYEMTPQPTYAAFRTASPAPSISPSENPGGYIAFNPQHSEAPTPMQLQPGPRRNLTVASHPPSEDGSYFPTTATAPALDIPQRSATAPHTLSANDNSTPFASRAGDNRLTTGYNDILDDYGHDGGSSAPMSSPSPVLEPSHHPPHFATMQDEYPPQSSQSAVRRPELLVDVAPRAHTAGPVGLPGQQYQQWQGFPGGRYGYEP